jgi:ribose 5-phosphate isomerase B
MDISIGKDHAGVDLERSDCSHLEQQGHNTQNHGTNSEDSVDYADFIHPVAQDVEDKKVDLGLLFVEAEMVRQ